jgi:hypothetical protein
MLNWLPFYKESIVKRNTLVYKRINGHYCVPEYLRSSLVRNCDLHNRVTRHCGLNLVFVKYKRETEGGRSFVVRITKEWNAIYECYMRNCCRNKRPLCDYNLV